MTENTKPDYLTYASLYVEPSTGVHNRKLKKSKRPVDKRTLSTKHTPTPLVPPMPRLEYGTMNEDGTVTFPINEMDTAPADHAATEGEVAR